ncbi:putative GMP reductase [Babesia divergens]|uniref:GMP reductase n=1 Tax=Babesia divergens TaxID=32595 RepID=A0A0D6DQK5_BABDI|nr:putative GMP reductase [Babesia divergens]CCX35041.1 guanosine monophosphate reductase [Babesia divergens]
MEAFDFQDIMLVPKKCVLATRADANVTAKLGKRTFKLPLIPANMPSVMNDKIATELAQKGYFYVMHRFDIDIVAFAGRMHEDGIYISISIGVRDEFYDVINDLKEINIIPDYITIDLAHGHTNAMRDMLAHIRSTLGNDVFVIAGNVATPEAVRDLESWGADATKIGIGPGYVCSTSIRTGFGTRNWQLSAIQACAKAAKKVVIADGGLRTSGDIVKAIHMGADWVMSGYFVAGCTQAPGETQMNNGVMMKRYYGNASSMNKQSNHRVEGTSVIVPCQGSIFDKLTEIEQDLQSAVSFAGGTRLTDVRDVEHVFVRRSCE